MIFDFWLLIPFFMDIRNIAIIAHVDHGKTTLVDGMLKQTNTFRDNQAEMQQTTILDSNDLEREKGITILAKNTAIQYKQTKINIIDTPGHADFSGEVERVINMADGALLIVDAAEGPLPQTHFVLQKALELNVKVIVVINKIDRKDARPQEVLHETEELFLTLAQHESHLHFPVLYAVGREEKAWDQLPEDPSSQADLTPIFEAIVKHIPAPQGDPTKPFTMLVSTLDFDSYKGTYAIGKILDGTVKTGDRVTQWNENKKLGSFSIEHVFTSKGLNREEVTEGTTGDIIAITGITDVGIGQTLAALEIEKGLPTIILEEPTLKILIQANTSPFAGREGDFVTARQIQERLEKEKKTNIGLKIEENTDGTGFLVSGRGELHLAILFENLRREGYEFQVGKPEVIMRDNDGHKEEPFEELTVEIPKEHIGVVTEELGRRRAEMLDTKTDDRGITRMVYKISSRNLLGFRGDILTKTRGTGLFASRMIGYFPEQAKLEKLRNSVLISTEMGKTTSYALETVQERGRLLVGPGVEVYEGMIIGINNRQEDIDMNAVKGKKLTNFRSNADIAVVLEPPINLSLEQCLDFIEEDELLEVTPEHLRLRKKFLTQVERKRATRN
jgi:GTP-binding protein